jgi:hypothetical protein
VAAAAGSVFAYVYTTMDPTSFLFIYGVTFIGYGILTGITELFGAVLVGFLFAVLPQITATPINGVNQTIPILTGVTLIFTVYSYPSGMAGFMKRLFRPDDETAQILTAGEFSPAPTRARQALRGNGHDRSGTEAVPPTPVPTAARAAAAPAAAATATLAERPASRYDDEREEAAWSRAAQVQGETGPTSAAGDGSGQDMPPPTTRRRPLRARAERPLRAPGRQPPRRAEPPGGEDAT